MTGVDVDAEQLAAIRGRVSALAVEVGEIARGAYVTKTMFTEASGSAAVAMDEYLHVLVEAANAMHDVAYKFAAYLDQIIVGFTQADADLARIEHVNTPKTER